MTDGNKLLTRHDAARHLRISIRGLDRLRQRGLIRGFLLGGRRMYRCQELRQLIKSMESQEPRNAPWAE